MNYNIIKKLRQKTSEQGFSWKLNKILHIHVMKSYPANKNDASREFLHDMINAN